MKYVELSEKNLDSVIRKYIDYYNSCEEGCWTYEKAYKRIHQVMTMEEIVIFSNYHNQGYGTALLMELERITRNNGAEHIELISVNDEHHMHFYKNQGFYSAGNLTMMGKHFALK